MNPSPEQLEQLSAYLDGELPPPERAMVERLLAGDAELRRELDAMRRAVEAVRSLPRERAPAGLAAGVASRIGQPLYRERVAAAAAAAPMPGSHWGQRVVELRRYAVAAVILLAAGVGSWAFLGRGTAVHAPARNEITAALRKQAPGSPGESIGSGGQVGAELKFGASPMQPAPVPPLDAVELARKDEKTDLRVAQVAGARRELDGRAHELADAPARARDDLRARAQTQKTENKLRAVSDGEPGTQEITVTRSTTREVANSSPASSNPSDSVRRPVSAPLGWDPGERIVWLFANIESADRIESDLQTARMGAATATGDRSTIRGFVTEVRSSGPPKKPGEKRAIPKDTDEPWAVQYFDEVRIRSTSAFAGRRDDLQYEQVFELHGESKWVEQLIQQISTKANEIQIGEFDLTEWNWRARPADPMSLGEGLRQSGIDCFPLVRQSIAGTGAESTYATATQRSSPWITVIVRVLAFKDSVPPATRSSSDAP